MALFRRTFYTGRMNQDVDNRILPQGEYRDAMNAVIINSEGSEEGAVQKTLSNKRLTNLDLGTNPECIGDAVNESRGKIYLVVISDTGCFLFEWDDASQSATFVLKDTRPLSTRVFNLKRKKYVTGINIIPSDDINKELLLLTDDNMEPLCINIERAKTYGENGFEREDIHMIKKWPAYAPIAQFVNTGSVENNLQERFLTFCYRHKYLDGEFSAYSTFTNYKFAPKASDIDYETFENLGMVNAFNAIRLGFDTGDKRVTDIQLLYKNSNSNTVYLIDTFNKEDNSWADNTIQFYTFTNNKIYTAMPEKELYRTFDNVPRKSKAQTVIGNQVMYANYVERYNLIDINNRKIAIDYTLSLNTRDLSGINVPLTISNGSSTNNQLAVNLAGIALNEGTRLSLTIVLKETTYSAGTYDQGIDFILNRNYTDAADLAADEDFIVFIEQVLTNNFSANYDADPPEDATGNTINGYTILSSTATSINIQGPSIVYTFAGDPPSTSYWAFQNETSTLFYNSESAASVKTNRSVEGGIIYEDYWGRKTTVLTSAKNTLFIPQDYSTFKNTILVEINNPPPAWADRYRIVIKAAPLNYQTIYCSIFYEDGAFRWIKLDGESKDKVKEGDWLIVKKDMSGPLKEVIKVKVLEVTMQEENFISGNNNDQGTEIIEPKGLYMKTKPKNVFLDYNANEFISDTGTGSASSGRPIVRTDQLYTDNSDGTYSDVPLTQGSVITLKFNSSGRDDGPYIFEKSYTLQNDYDNFKDWFDANITLPLDVPDSDHQYTNVRVVRGIPVGNNGVNETPGVDTNPLFLLVEGIIAGNGSLSTGRKGYLETTVTIRLVDGYAIFETEEEAADIDAYFETEQTFPILNNHHIGNLQNQNSAQPARLELNFFNCFSQGNGAESYRVKDAVNKKYLHIDLKPTSTDPTGYREIRRAADITYGEPYVESTNTNGLNVFNLSTANYKDNIDKQYGSIQKLHSRNGNILVLQEEKPGQVLYNKNAIYAQDGSAEIVGSVTVLGDYIPYNGNRGIGTNPESFSTDDKGRVKYASVKNGTVVRLSVDGVEDITYGMKQFFRNIFTANKNAKVISGFDPHYDHTVFSIGDEPEILPLFQCSAVINKFNQAQPFSYNLQLNNLGGDIVFNYNITQGNATITAEFNGSTTVVSNTTGSGTITIPRTSLVENIVEITITPISGAISYSITNTCPIGSELKIVNVVLNDDTDAGKTITDRFRTNGSSFISTDEMFLVAPLTRFETLTGLEGVGAFPTNGNLVTIQSYKDNSNSGQFLTTECNRLGYLISTIVYTQFQYQNILDNPDTQFLTVATTGEEGFAVTNSGSFVFNRTDTDEILYLIWDYTNRNPVISDDTANIDVGESVIINVLANDEVGPDATVSIGTPPLYGTAVVNIDRTITYTHDGSDNLNDGFTYVVTDNGCSSTANVTISVGVSCGGTVPANGSEGIYETTINFGTDIGWCGIRFNSQNVPDRWEMYYDGVKVADSKYTGDGISAGPPTFFAGLLGPKTLDIFTYAGGTFVDSGLDESITVIQSDIADNITEPIDGNGYLTFYKPTTLPTTVLLRTTGAVGGTGWNLENVICPTPAEALIDGELKLYYGFFVEGEKTLVSRSIGLVLDIANNKFYTNIFGLGNMTMFSGSNVWNTTRAYINDGINWWRIDVDGNILETGTI